ncbi:uncharacterized protein BDZ99DRAFT_469446 [Mytilinidion resinicola]|uniref:Uncharacterized protein n=1 Tax=Mytilinidion resinicola TaxID=574789 RepID=A0A6A6Y0F7_9PEZI|nr:uncharacterized protein BDZ99DRAFT_469446 [Mytilinidion resinicola]KAF2801705.1 hypothetical protein BDZ99DRAFT_469446 [Mytilinidion resinicola]
MSGSGSDAEADEDEVQKWQKAIDDIEARREMTKVAWTSGRFCHRVRVMVKPEVKFPEKSTFREFDENGELVRFQYEKWIGHLFLYITQDMGSRCIDDSTDLPFNRDILVQNVERIIMASGPWQEWLLTLRSIYRWEDPKVTGRWFAVWAFVWYLNCTISFTLCYVVFIVLQNRFCAQPIEKLRASHERALDRGKSALKFGDLINRHGSSDWIDPLIDGVGPVAQVQLGDIADLMEILVNFYNWKYPRLTAYTIFFFSTCITVGLLTPADFSLKIVTMIIIWWFFFGRFVASYHPQYRHLVSPIKYVYWDIPTHAEWAFTYLRKTAQEVRQKMIERKVQHQYDIETREHPTYQGNVASAPSQGGDGDSDGDDWHSAKSSGGILDETDFICFRCSHHGVPGQLAIYSDGIRFIRKFPNKEMWRRSFSEIAEMNKLTGSRTVKLKKERLLEFTFMGGVVEKLEDMKRMDEAFNAIIGFSGLHWQQLQPRHEANVET